MGFVFEKQNMSKKNSTKKSALILFSGCRMIHFEGRMWVRMWDINRNTTTVGEIMSRLPCNFVGPTFDDLCVIKINSS